MIRGLAHIGLTVVDLDTMLDFYTRVLDLRVDCQVPHPRGGTITFLKAAGGQADQEVIEMIRYADPKPHQGRESFRTGLRHFALYVKDVQQQRQRLEALGVAFDDAHETDASDEVAVIDFWDPEGNRVRLVERGY